MRMMMKVQMPVEAGNAAALNGTLGSTIQKILGEMKPEAAYFVADGGMRTGLLFFHMTESSQLPALAEPWFIALNANVTVTPAMSLQDLGIAASSIEAAAKNYGS